MNPYFGCPQSVKNVAAQQFQIIMSCVLVAGAVAGVRGHASLVWLKSVGIVCQFFICSLV